ncbi:hypothetical protein RHECNPAF_3500087 [Rhizobium etli CNPAF512]|nr:hypothetical protein RHECNPAF_3500087 [Rhizobium etli CNPAF512]
MTSPSSDHTAIGAQRLAIDPAAIRAGEEGDRRRDVLGRAEALQRVHLRHAGDEFLRFAVEEKIGGDRTGRNRIDSDGAAAHFLGHDRRQRFDGRLGRGVDAIGLKLQPDDRGREVDDPAAVAQAPGGLPQRVEGALEVDADLAVEGFVVGLGERGEHHDTGIVDEHVDAAEGGFRGIEHATHGVRIADIGFRGQRLATGLLDLPGEVLGRRGIAGIVDDDGKTVSGEALGNRRADTAGSAGNQCDLAALVGSHCSSPSSAPQRVFDGKKMRLLLERIIVHSSASLSGKGEQTDGQVRCHACVLPRRRASQLHPCRRRYRPAALDRHRCGQAARGPPRRTPAPAHHAPRQPDARRRGLLPALPVDPRRHRGCRRGFCRSQTEGPVARRRARHARPPLRVAKPAVISSDLSRDRILYERRRSAGRSGARRHRLRGARRYARG